MRGSSETSELLLEILEALSEMAKLSSEMSELSSDISELSSETLEVAARVGMIADMSLRRRVKEKYVRRGSCHYIRSEKTGRTWEFSIS